MARKSRKNNQATIQIMQEESSYCMTAIYARLSVENSRKDDNGDSIENQIRFCKDYLKQHSDLKLYSVYKDNGETGTDFDRPAFRCLMDDVRQGNVKCIVVKDLSRFGRNYIETGEYLEKIFPFLGIRFIAITDKYDSLTSKDISLILPLKNMINDAYAKDISRKIITSFKARQEKGEYRPALAPYGYLKSKSDKYRYEIDPETAPYVKKIFEWKVSGVSHSEICRRLNKMGAITPAMRKVELGSWNAEKYKNNIWYEKSRTLIEILKNPIYTGSMVYGKKPESLYEGIKKHRADSKDWKILPNMHEAIISQEVFDKVQQIFAQKRIEVVANMEQSKEDRERVVNLFKNKIYCGDCGKRMRFKRIIGKTACSESKYTYENARFVCGGYIDTGQRNCTTHNIRYLTICDVALVTIKSQLEFILKQEELLKQLNGADGKESIFDFYSQHMKQITWELQRVNTKREQLYENFIEGVLDESEYRFAKKTYDEMATKLQTQLEELKQKKDHVNELLVENELWLAKLRSTEGKTELNQEIVDDMIKRIDVYEDKRVEVQLNYREEQLLFESILEEWIGEEKKDVSNREIHTTVTS